jgi:hypothetical protein
MRRYYVARKGDQIIIAQLAEEGALYLHKEGYELANEPFDTREQTDAEKQAWRERLKKLQQRERDDDSS